VWGCQEWLERLQHLGGSTASPSGPVRGRDAHLPSAPRFRERQASRLELKALAAVAGSLREMLGIA
jgi:hypothetical protein